METLTEDNVNNLIRHMDTLWQDMAKVHYPIDTAMDDIRRCVGIGFLSPREGNRMLDSLQEAKEQLRKSIEFTAFLRKAVMDKSSKYKDVV